MRLKDAMESICSLSDLEELDICNAYLSEKRIAEILTHIGHNLIALSLGETTETQLGNAVYVCKALLY
jgi:hypothetical protein